MKKLIVFFSTVFILLLSSALHAQSTTGADYFSGKWNVLLKDVPGGDRPIIIILEKQDSTLTGVVQDGKGIEFSKITKAELKGTELTIYFSGEGHDLSLLMVKKDEDHITGRLIDRFDAEGERVKDK
jgi:hypothetical protein